MKRSVIAALIVLSMILTSIAIAVNGLARGSESGEFPDRVFTLSKMLRSRGDKAVFEATILPSENCSWWVELGELGGSAVKVEVVKWSDQSTLSRTRLTEIGQESEHVALVAGQEYRATLTYLGKAGTAVLMERISTGPPVTGVWQDATLLQSMSEYEQAAVVRMDDQGNAMVFWEQPFIGNTSAEATGLWWNRYDHTTGWGTAAKLWDGDFMTGWTAFGMGPNGQAVAGWLSPFPNIGYLYLALYDPAVGWEGPTAVPAGTTIGEITADVDRDGNAMVVVASQPGMALTAWRHEVGSYWQSDLLLTGGGGWPVVRYDGSGCALLMWNDFNSYQVKSMRYVPGAGWGPIMVASGSVGGYWVEFDVDESGLALAVFFKSNGTAWEMYGNLFDPATGWGTPTRIGPVAGGWHPSGGYVAAAGPGEFFIVWQQYDRYENGNGSVWSRTWTSSSGSGPAVRLSSASSVNPIYPCIAACTGGQALAAWTETEGALSSVVARLYVPGIGWGNQVVIDSSDKNRAWLPSAAMAPDGDIAVIWRQSDGRDDLLWGRVYLV